ncbi:vWA domain-containing protein [Tengunoibacter tsumagoiensis]|uniref:VWA domain-containing protein n=1 Tax=Tengunoibacter tsumagoiensis TaxID=2014871 RepID=A0A402A389_9CHLR|nr:VWA domain-containing protein [Tengunoibacter tsumagoiensis]GCE13628.1 VWA domain-containing protein [Tengunoibacter tsumagoiensis]
MFTVKAYHNPYLRLGQTTMQAVLSMKVDETVAVAPAPLSLAIALDRSGSMDGTKMRAARDGAIKVVQALDDSMIFLVVTFNDNARVLFGPAVGNAENKKRAIAALQSVSASSGTRMSTALNTIVDKLSADSSRAVKILFLTDGKNEGEQRQALDRAVARCSTANMSINAWGVGTDWDAAELLHMAGATRGSADIIPTPNQIESAFSTSFSEMRKTAIANTRLSLWTPVGVRIAAIQQVYPSIVPLGIEPDPASPRQQVLALGSFAPGDQRDYLLDLDLTANAPGQQFMVVRPSFKYTVSGNKELEEKSDRTGWVFVQWTEDMALAAQIEEHIAHYTNQEELSRHIKEGQDALAAGDKEKATRLLGRALEISERTGNARVTKLLTDIVSRDAKGTIRLNTQADAVARKTLAINMSKTSKLK